MDDKYSYIVELVSVLDDIVNPVVCSEEEMVLLLNNYDKELYRIGNVHCIGIVDFTIKKYLTKDDNLETGKKE
jgi:hypothetical protein